MSEIQTEQKEKLMTAAEVAEWLTLDENTVTKRARQGRLPAYNLDGIWRFSRAEIQEYLNSRRVQPSSTNTK